MKKELLAFSVLSAAFALVAGEYVTPNHIGRCDVTTASSLKTIIPVPFLDYNAVPDKATEIKVGDLIQVGNLAADDKLYKVNGASYKVWTLNSEKTAWVPVDTVLLGADAGSGEPVLKRGDGFWLETSATTVTLMGQVPSSEAAVDVSLSAGWNLVGVSNLAGKNLKDIEGAAQYDIIIFSDGSKIECGSSKEWKNRDGKIKDFKASTYVLPAGAGFWYYTKTKDAKTITL